MTDRLDHRCLSAEQEEVVDAPVDAQLLVLAGAGTGKTHTLIERLNHLVERDEVPPGSGVLVLSFTRAAVGEIRDRLRSRDGDAGFVRARTFDSFATRVLNELGQDDAWMIPGVTLPPALKFPAMSRITSSGIYSITSAQDRVSK